MQFSEVTEHVARGEPLVQTGVGGQESDGVLYLLRVCCDFDSSEDSSPGGGLHEPAEQAQAGGLSCSVWP